MAIVPWGFIHWENNGVKNVIDEELNDNIIAKCRKFLERSSNRWSEDIDSQERALEVAGGRFWNDDAKKRWSFIDESSNKDIIPTISYNNISPQVNAIASPFSRSPFHVNVVNKDDNGKRLQDFITNIEGNNKSKMVYQQAMTRGVKCSAGFITIGTNLDKENNIIPNIEFISNQKMVAFDPDCITPSGEDAEEGALVYYISIAKARREYGADVIPTDFPKTQPKLSFNNIDAWSDKEDKIQLVKYFRKERQKLRDENGEVIFDELGNAIETDNTVVMMYTICGNYVVKDPVELTTDIIPIVRFAGYEDYDTEYGTVYTGYVQKMYTHIEQMSLALTMQATRMRRCSSVRVVSGTSAVEGCEGYFVDFEKGSSIALIYNDKNGASAPTIMNDTFPTNDISQALQECRQTMQECSGVNLAGLNTTERTAYEIMQQQVNSESNVQEVYLHAEAACHTIGKIMLGILNNGIVPEFTLEGGPSVITSQMKERAEIQAIASMVPAEHQELLAIKMADTITSNIGKQIANDIKANCGLKLTEGQDVGSLMNAMTQMQQTLDETMKELESKAAEADELRKANEQLEMQLADNSAARELDVAKFRADMAHKEAQLAVENKEAAKKLAQKDDEIALKARNDAEENRRKNYELMLNAESIRNGGY